VLLRGPSPTFQACLIPRTLHPGRFRRLADALGELCTNSNYKTRAMQQVILSPEMHRTQAVTVLAPPEGTRTLTGRELNAKQRMAVAQATRPLPGGEAGATVRALTRYDRRTQGRSAI
jgi:hypothetical protein